MHAHYHIYFNEHPKGIAIFETWKWCSWENLGQRKKFWCPEDNFDGIRPPL